MSQFLPSSLLGLNLWNLCPLLRGLSSVFSVSTSSHTYYRHTYTRTLWHTHTHEVVAGGGEAVRRSSCGGCASLATGAARGVESAVWVGVLSGDVGVGVEVGVCAWLFCWAAAMEV